MGPSIRSRLEAIPRARLPGRPVKDVPTAYAAHRENLSVYRDQQSDYVIEPSKCLGMHVAGEPQQKKLIFGTFYQ